MDGVAPTGSLLWPSLEAMAVEPDFRFRRPSEEDIVLVAIYASTV